MLQLKHVKHTDLTLKLQEEMDLIEKNAVEINEFKDYFANVDTNSKYYKPELVKQHLIRVLRRQVHDAQKISL